MPNYGKKHRAEPYDAREEACPEEFLVIEHDGSGRSMPVYFRIPPLVMQEVEIALCSTKLPFQTKEELYRWAFCLGLRLLKRTKAFEYSSPLLRLPLVLYNRHPRIGTDEFLREIHKIVGNLAALGYRTPALHKFIGVIEGLVECLPSAYDREKYLGAMEKDWRFVLSGANWPKHPSRKGYRGRR